MAKYAERKIVEDAVRWGLEIGRDGQTNYEAFVRMLNSVRTAFAPNAFRGHPVVRQTLNSAKARFIDERAMPREYYSVLLRIAIMDYPQFVNVDTPMLSELDTQGGVAFMQLSAKRLTGRRPQVRSWQVAAYA